MQQGKLYRATEGFILQRFEPSLIPEIDIKVQTTTVATNQRRLLARWKYDMAQDLQAYYGMGSNSTVPVQTANLCEVPKGWIVMYVETGKTGSYKLICDDFIGWVSDTLNLLEELKEDEQ